ncbi:hypothetical protein IAG44_29405 [Streptomyces roseirectus]|uniref:Large membrane protein n=1 Tax=Streptomyces roseirectus TaxID=2768066 RepID=A0A7H0IK32_9ACTN|nr:hypothetical protein [Streptomyces roseirectus]QNP73148.1 hypothetical protein IAG44_29405 [Streptomyces roseirectus]
MNTDRPDHDDAASPTPKRDTTPEETEAKETKAEAANEAEVEGVRESAGVEADADVSSGTPVSEEAATDAEASADDDVVVEDTGRIRRLGPVEEAPAETPEEAPGEAPGEVVEGGRRRRPSALVVALAAAVAVLLVGGGGALVASNASGGADEKESAGVPAGEGTDGPPPGLSLDGYTAPGAGGGNGIAPGEPNPYGTTYQATGSLPDGPKEAPVYWANGEVDRAEVVRLAKAFGIDGAPVVEGPAWRVGEGQDGTGPVLRVNRTAPGMWTFTRYAPGTDDCARGPVCEKKPLDGTGAPVGEAEARKAAEPVLKAVGQDDAKIDASGTAGAQRIVNADPVIGELPTNGWTTGVTVSGTGEVISGTGQLAAPEKGDAYPVLSAARTLELLNSAQANTHRMGIGGCATPMPLEDGPERPCGKLTGAPQPSVAKVTGATFGLAAHTSQGRQLLVPSWLFTVQAAEPYVVTYPAVDPEYLAAEATPAPPSPSPDQSAPRNVKVDGYSASGNELTVNFTGGVCGDYNVAVRETDAQVTVTVTQTPWKDKVCIMIAKEFSRTVELGRPLGDRAVVGVDGAAIPLAKAGARLPEPVR